MGSGAEKRHVHKCKYLSAANQPLSRHANLRLEICGICNTCLGVLGNKSHGSQLLVLAAGNLERPPSPSRVGKNSRKQRQQNLKGHCADCSQSPLKDSCFLQGGEGATGHEESFPDFLLRLPIRRSVGSSSNGPKPPIHITSSIIHPDDK